jgi:hypothetical protein
MNRAWAYIISKQLSDTEIDQLIYAGKAFVTTWTAHENKLSADFRVFKKRIILVSVNENVNNASGCSIDKLTRFMKETESSFGIELLNRFLVAFKDGEDIQIVHSSKVKELLDQKIISGNTIVYNTAVANEDELQNWEQALKNTWLNKYLSIA